MNKQDKQLKRIHEWALSKKGRNTLLKATKLAKEANKQIDDEIKFDYKKLDKRITI